MKKRQFFAILIVGMSLLSGCRQSQPAETMPNSRIVKKVSASYSMGKLELQRSYIQDEKIRTVLMYLRLLKPKDGAAVDPERLEDSSGEIAVEYADGRRNVYYLRGDSFLSFNGHKWQSIDPNQGKWLRPLLESIPGDEVQ